MPCLYAHDTFGRKVRTLLPEEIGECIDTYEDQFRLGLQGPDFLFFYRPLTRHPVNRLGHNIHKKPGAFYLKKILPIVRRRGQYSPEAAYLLGFCCHFMLDSKCHPYVEKKMEDTGLDHVEIEGEFDKFLMKKDGIRPETYPQWKKVPVDSLTVRTLSHMYPWISQKDTRASLYSFRFCKWLMTAQNPCKKQLLIWAMKSIGLYKKLKGQYLWDEVTEGSEPVSMGLLIRYEEEIEKAAAMVESVWEQIGTSDTIQLSPRFFVNFSGLTRAKQE